MRASEVDPEFETGWLVGFEAVPMWFITRPTGASHRTPVITTTRPVRNRQVMSAIGLQGQHAIALDDGPVLLEVPPSFAYVPDVAINATARVIGQQAAGDAQTMTVRRAAGACAVGEALPGTGAGMTSPVSGMTSPV